MAEGTTGSLTLSSESWNQSGLGAEGNLSRRNDAVMLKLSDDPKNMKIRPNTTHGQFQDFQLGRAAY